MARRYRNYVNRIHRCSKCRSKIYTFRCVLCDGYRPTEQENKGVKAMAAQQLTGPRAEAGIRVVTVLVGRNGFLVAS